AFDHREVDVRGRLRPGDVIGAADAVPARQAKAFEVAGDPRPARVRCDPQADTHRACLLPPFAYARQDGLDVHELELAGPVSSPQGLPVESDPETLLQLRHRVEEARGVAYHRLPQVHRQLLAVAAA